MDKIEFLKNLESRPGELEDEIIYFIYLKRKGQTLRDGKYVYGYLIRPEKYNVEQCLLKMWRCAQEEFDNNMADVVSVPLNERLRERTDKEIT